LTTEKTGRCPLFAPNLKTAGISREEYFRLLEKV